MVEQVDIEPNGPCPFCGGWIPDGEGGSRPCPVCGTPCGECITCNGDGLVELDDDEGKIVAGYLAEGLRHDPRTGDELVTMLPCPDCPPLSKRPGELPLDYEPCGDCGFDHDYDYPAAAEWHTANPGSYPWEIPACSTS